MSLINDLKSARTEEDVKDAYIKALNLQAYSKNLIDIQTQEVWFEAKDSPTPAIVMFAQLLFYVRAARRRGEPIPAFLAVIDREKAALMPTEKALKLLKDKSIKWPKSGSGADQALGAQIAPYVQAHIVEYDIADDEKAFVKAVKDAISQRKIIRTPITPDNLRQVFDRWVDLIGTELGVEDEADYAVLFFADIMHDGTNEKMANLPARMLMTAAGPTFLLDGKVYDLAHRRGYQNFWAMYHRPPEKKHRHYLLERRDSLLPMDEQKFKGAYYTPLHIVDKAYDELRAALGDDWQDRYLVWDMCAGVGNLEAKHSNLRNVYMSTLDSADVKIMQSNPAFSGAEIFQYDYLNDDITDFGEIDYSLTNKLPESLRKALADASSGKVGAKPILVLINPPYAEVTSGGNSPANTPGNSKPGVTKTQYAKAAMDGYGKASNELFMQFMARLDKEIPNSHLAMFSKLKYISTPTLSDFRNIWRAEYLGGFVFESKLFEGLKGKYPIGFLIWDLGAKKKITSVATEVLDRNAQIVGEKIFYNYDEQALLTNWVERPPSNKSEVIPLKNAITPATAKKDLRGRFWSDGAVAWLNCGGNDFQHANRDTFLFSSGYSSARGFFVTPENLWQAAVVFTVRRIIKPTWLNDRDQFLQPSQDLPEEFKRDCLVWMLFNSSNLTAGADGLEWGDRDWSLTNHFVPFREDEVGAKGRFESAFMAEYVTGLKFSSEAQLVLDEGRKLWACYHSIQFPRKIRDELKLNRNDVGWFQVRRALEAYHEAKPVDFEPLKEAYEVLTEKLIPRVFGLGFLPEPKSPLP